MKLHTKILITILIVTILSLASVSFSTFRFIRSMRADITSAIDVATENAVKGISTIQKRQLYNQLLRIADGNANFMDAHLGEWRRQTEVLAELATDIFTNPQKYTLRRLDLPQRGNKELSAQLLFSKADVDRAALAQDIGKSANVLDYLFSLFKHSNMADHATLAMESGFLIDLDKIADFKFSSPEAEEPDLFHAQERPWYIQIKKDQKFEFSDAFRDFFTKEFIIAGAAPVYRRGEFVGVASISFLLSKLQEQVLKTSIGTTGYGFIFNDKGSVFISPKTTGDTAVDETGVRDLRRGGNKRLAATIRYILGSGYSGVQETVVDGREVYLAYSPLNIHRWYFATVIDKDEAHVIINNLEEELTHLNHEARSTIQVHVYRLLYALLGLTGFGVGLAFLASQVAVRWLINPLRIMTVGVQRISEGDLDVSLPVETDDEVGMLAASFNKMTGDLKTNMAELARVAAEKQRISTELEVANQIQTSMLPNVFPPLHGFVTNSAYDIFATMKPAKEVGGDMYDFFVIDEDRLGLVIADVCGKGIPAALYMVVVKTLVKNHALHTDDPAKVFEIVNNQLCEDNSATMFATALFAVFDFKTMNLTFANAGHPAPLIRKAGEQFEPDFVEPGPPLGSMEGVQYARKVVSLSEGATLFFYTDGVTEAQDDQERLFSEERLLKLLRERVAADALPKDIIMLVEQEVTAFTGDREAFDDMTMLVFTVVPNQGKGDSPPLAMIS